MRELWAVFSLKNIHIGLTTWNADFLLCLNVAEGNIEITQNTTAVAQRCSWDCVVIERAVFDISPVVILPRQQLTKDRWLIATCTCSSRGSLLHGTDLFLSLSLSISVSYVHAGVCGEFVMFGTRGKCPSGGSADALQRRVRGHSGQRFVPW